MKPASALPKTLESDLQEAILSLYAQVAENPASDFHFFHGREAAEMFAYPTAWLDAAAGGAVESFAGVGNPHERAELLEGERVLDLGSGAGLDSILAARQVGPSGKSYGLDFNDTMRAKAVAHAAASGADVEYLAGRIEDIPLPDSSVDAVISNGVLNLSFQKRRVLEEMYRVIAPGGRVSFCDIVSARSMPQTIVEDPNLWAS